MLETNCFQHLLTFLSNRKATERTKGGSIATRHPSHEWVQNLRSRMPLNKLMSKVHHNQRSKKINLDE